VRGLTRHNSRPEWPAGANPALHDRVDPLTQQPASLACCVTLPGVALYKAVTRQDTSEP
jgi:hypothetical protein